MVRIFHFPKYGLGVTITFVGLEAFRLHQDFGDRFPGSGQPVVPGWIRRAPAIRRGQPLTIVAQSATVTIRADGVATSDAQIADRVRVRNRSSGREVDAVVRAADLVEVRLD